MEFYFFSSEAADSYRKRGVSRVRDYPWEGRQLGGGDGVRR